MLEALWSVEFFSNVQGTGAGVAVLETGRIFGGDGSYYYIGEYKAESILVKATVKITHYSGQQNSIFGQANEFNLILEGEPEQDVFELHGYVQENKDLKIGIRLTRRAELP